MKFQSNLWTGVFMFWNETMWLSTVAQLTMTTTMKVKYLISEHEQSLEISLKHKCCLLLILTNKKTNVTVFPWTQIIRYTACIYCYNIFMSETFYNVAKIYMTIVYFVSNRIQFDSINYSGLETSLFCYIQRKLKDRFLYLHWKVCSFAVWYVSVKVCRQKNKRL